MVWPYDPVTEILDILVRRVDSLGKENQRLASILAEIVEAMDKERTQLTKLLQSFVEHAMKSEEAVVDLMERMETQERGFELDAEENP